MLPRSHDVLRDPRLLARSFTSADIAAFAAYRADPDVARYQSWSDFTLADAEAFVASLQGEEPGIPGEWFQIALERVGRCARRRPRPARRRRRATPGGGGLHPGAGRSRARATPPRPLTGLLDWAFPAFRLHRVIAITDALNSSAAALLERVGFRREAHLVENVFFKGAWGSELSFAVLAHEWAARRA